MKTVSRAFCSIALFLVLLTYSPRGCAQDSTCLSKLQPCLNYLNGTENPPDSCCEPLKSVIESDAKCLCSLVSSRGTRQAKQAGINIDEAQKLPGRCGQHVNLLSCLTESHGSRNSDQNSATKLMHVSKGVVLTIIVWAVIAHV